MGRKSNSSSSNEGPATVMGLRMIQCGRQTVHVIQPDGQVRQFVVPVKVADLLHLYPHNFVSHAAVSTVGGPKRALAILPLDTYLETGTIYVLLPLPRLFPSALPPPPHLCACFLNNRPEDSGAIGAIKAEFRRHWPAGGTYQSSSKISPEDGAGISSSGGSELPRRLWEPALEIISEDKVLVTLIKEEDGEKKENLGGKGKKKNKLVSAAFNNLKIR